ncbi:hypothetical protein MNEG_10954 [Monoraphidium neglectum]|uniref:RRM domain-containing protein n=1 Tax=Monoraphidium neglectum TaxID=145388 RepID=A0A0D2M036_9CHLO|nr:hypothetical protein MNEG_10954 [Monoraphidium neglectum]KIY97009.1 hypothetical protein MNEG_10954 [Monoraphidium neglectum]|eukprot:XP_013896029.1 hypothetical protein MNEG_10954 [Monoraphidium neglectum]
MPQVESLFRSYGDVVSTRLVRASRLGGATKTFAFVKLGDVQQAMAAIRALNQTPCGGLGLLEVKFADADAGDRNPELRAPPSDNVYAKNLPGSYSEDDLRALFAQYGDGAGALVRLGSVADAQRAIAALHNQRLPDSKAPLVVRFADSADHKAKKAARMGRAYNRWAASVGAGGGGGGADRGRRPSNLARYASGSVGSGSDLGEVLGGAVPGFGGGGFGVRERDSSIYIKYLPEETDKLFLYEKFAPFGAVHSVKRRRCALCVL